jgi:hypothetical protein
MAGRSINVVRIVEVIRTELSDGTFIRITKYGRSYSFMHSSLESRVPEMHHNLTKAEAYQLYEDALKKDVLETD